MAIITLKSKKEVTVNVVSLRKDFITLDIDTEQRNPLSIEVQGRYSEFTTGDFIKNVNFSVPNAMANQLGAVTIPQNTSLIDTRNIQLTAGIFSILGQYQDFGLTMDDWELINP